MCSIVCPNITAALTWRIAGSRHLTGTRPNWRVNGRWRLRWLLPSVIYASSFLYERLNVYSPSHVIIALLFISSNSIFANILYSYFHTLLLFYCRTDLQYYNLSILFCCRHWGLSAGSVQPLLDSDFHRLCTCSARSSVNFWSVGIGLRTGAD